MRVEIFNLTTENIIIYPWARSGLLIVEGEASLDLHVDVPKGDTGRYLLRLGCLADELYHFRASLDWLSFPTANSERRLMNKPTNLQLCRDLRMIKLVERQTVLFRERSHARENL